MSRKRRSYEAGHKPKFLVVIDDTPECDRAVYFASRRAARVAVTVVMLRVIETHDHGQQWLGVADIMRAEAREEANAMLAKFAGRSNGIAGITPECVIREGDVSGEILKLIEEDEDIASAGAGCRRRQRRAGAAGEQSRQDRGLVPGSDRDRAGASHRRRTRRDELAAGPAPWRCPAATSSMPPLLSRRWRPARASLERKPIRRGRSR